MKNIITKFGGAIFFYIVIVGMVVAVNYRFKELNEVNEEQIAYLYIEDEKN